MAQQFSGAPYMNSYGVQDRYSYNGEMPPEIATQQQSLNRKQQIANLLLQQGMQGAGPGQMVGRFFVPTSGTQHAAKLGELLAGMVGTHANDQAEQGLSQQQHEMTAQAITDYIRKTSPQPVTTEQQGPGAPVPSSTANEWVNQLSPGEVHDGRISQELASGGPGMTQEGPRPTTTTMQPASPDTKRAELIKLMTSQIPGMQQFAQLQAQQDQMGQEHQAQRDFLSTEKAADRDAKVASDKNHIDMLVGLKIMTQEQGDKAKEEADARHAELVKGMQTNSLEAQKSMNAATNATRREALQTGKVPPGYRASPDGNLEAIPGGPADLKQQGAFSADTAMLESSDASFDQLIDTANQLINHPGLPGITGIRGKVPDIPGSDAANARGLLEKLKAETGLGVLQEMKNNSKSGSSGLGAVSDAEGKRLENKLAALDTKQSLEQFKSELQHGIIGYAQGAKARLRDAYNLKHKNGEPTGVSTQATPAQPDYPTATGPGGKKLIFKDGSWQPAQ